jgi:hypothetical protein
MRTTLNALFLGSLQPISQTKCCLSLGSEKVTMAAGTEMNEGTEDAAAQQEVDLTAAEPSSKRDPGGASPDQKQLATPATTRRTVKSGDRCSDQDNPMKPPVETSISSSDTAVVAQELMKETPEDLTAETVTENNKGSSSEMADEEKKDVSSTEALIDHGNSVEVETELQLDEIITASETGAGVSGVNNSSNDNHSSNDNTLEKKPVDASGMCSFDHADIPVGQDKLGIIDESEPDRCSALSPDPPEVHKEKTPLPVAPQIEAFSSPKKLETIEQPLITPVGSPETHTGDASGTNHPPVESPDGPSLPQGLLQNKNKEGFALLVRGDSFNDTKMESSVSSSRPPVDPDALHRRVGSNFVSLSRNNSGRHVMDELEDLSSQRHATEEQSYQQMSYPTSPQTMPPQAITYNNGYVVMPPMAQPPHAFVPQPPPQQMHQPPHVLQHQASFGSQAQIMGRTSFGYQAVPAMPPMPSPMAHGGKRKIKLSLQEEILAKPIHARRKSFFFRSSRDLDTPESLGTTPGGEQVNEVDRGTITVSWFEGTSSTELAEHVTRSVSRKLKLNDDQTLDDIRILDTNVDPPEGRLRTKLFLAQIYAMKC